jgi:hypothetical protein
MGASSKYPSLSRFSPFVPTPMLITAASRGDSPDAVGKFPELPSQKTRFIIVLVIQNGLPRILHLAALDKGGII